MTANPILLRPLKPCWNLKEDQVSWQTEKRYKIMNLWSLETSKDLVHRQIKCGNQYLVLTKLWDAKWELKRTQSIWWSQTSSLLLLAAPKFLWFIYLYPCAVSQHLSAYHFDLSAHADKGRKIPNVEGNWPHISELQDSSIRLDTSHISGDAKISPFECFLLWVKCNISWAWQWQTNDIFADLIFWMVSHALLSGQFPSKSDWSLPFFLSQ